MGLVIDFLALDEPADEAEDTATPAPRQVKQTEPDADEERLEPAIAL